MLIWGAGWPRRIADSHLAAQPALVRQMHHPGAGWGDHFQWHRPDQHPGYVSSSGGGGRVRLPGAWRPGGEAGRAAHQVCAVGLDHLRSHLRPRRPTVRLIAAAYNWPTAGLQLRRCGRCTNDYVDLLFYKRDPDPRVFCARLCADDPHCAAFFVRQMHRPRAGWSGHFQ